MAEIVERRYDVLEEGDVLTPGVYEAEILVGFDSPPDHYDKVAEQILNEFRARLVVEFGRALPRSQQRREFPQILARDVTYSVPTIVDDDWRMTVVITFEVHPQPIPRPAVVTLMTVKVLVGIILAAAVLVPGIRILDLLVRRMGEVIVRDVPRALSVVIWGAAAFVLWVLFRDDIKRAKIN